MCWLYPETFLCVTNSTGGCRRPPAPVLSRGCCAALRFASRGSQSPHPTPDTQAHVSPGAHCPWLGSPCRHPAGLPGGKGGQSGRRGGRPLHRQQPGRPAGALPPGHAVPDSHPQLQHALVSSPGGPAGREGLRAGTAPAPVSPPEGPEVGGPGQPLCPSGACPLLSQGRQLAGGHGSGRGPQPRPVTLWAGEWGGGASVTLRGPGMSPVSSTVRWASSTGLPLEPTGH